MDDLHLDSSVAPVEPAEGGAARARPPEPRRRRRWLLFTLTAPMVLLALLVIAWAIDTSSDEVARNVRLAEVGIGGLSRDELTGRLAQVASDFATTPVELTVGDTTYRTTAKAIGLMVDETATAENALDARQSSFLPTRPFAWAGSFFTTEDAEVAVRVNAEQVASEVVALQGDDRVPPTEPTVELVDGSFSVVPGDYGTGIDPTEVVRRLPAAAVASTTAQAGVIRLEVTAKPIPPSGSIEAAQAAASDAEALVDAPLEVRTASGNRTVSPDLLRSWVRLASRPDGTVDVSLDDTSVQASLRFLFADVDGHPVDASFTLADGVPVITADRPGQICCAAGAVAGVLEALHRPDRVAELQLVDGPAGFRSADAKTYGITQAVGGNEAWRDGVPTTAGPGFTTYHDPVGSRIVNIHRIADIVRGAVIPPGGRFSINDYVGPRTAAKGFVPAGAIRDGLHVEEIGGGVSQFATTTFNAAYFAGLEIETYQAHSEWFSRYPRGREATMGYPAPDLAFVNDTPYGIMIWTSYTDSSLTVTLYSTPYGRAAQTGIAEAPAGNCTLVTTTRTITFPDGKSATDQFRARYRPAEGVSC